MLRFFGRQRGDLSLECLRLASTTRMRGVVRQMSVTCAFRFEVKPDDEVVELDMGSFSVHVCENCLTLIAVHRRIHHMKLEKLIPQMAQR